MSTTRLSSKGQVIIPKTLRNKHKWRPGQQFETIDREDGVLLKPALVFPLTSLQEVAACLPFKGKAKTLEDMEAAIKVGAKKSA